MLLLGFLQPSPFCLENTDLILFYDKKNFEMKISLDSLLLYIDQAFPVLLASDNLEMDI